MTKRIEQEDTTLEDVIEKTKSAIKASEEAITLRVNESMDILNNKIEGVDGKVDRVNDKIDTVVALVRDMALQMKGIKTAAEVNRA